jgi:subtilisin family serine protease
LANHPHELAPPDQLLIDTSLSVKISSDRSVSSHATNIASIVAGESNRISGIAPGVRLLPLVVNLSSQVYAERAEALSAAAEIARNRRRNGQTFARMVVSCSWRTSGDIASIRTALQELVQAGVVPVFSAGNDDSNAAHFPSDYGASAGALGNAVLSVAATDRNDHKAEYSNYSTTVTICAPGGDGLPLDDRDIFCADQGGTYGWTAGTSIAAPHVAGLVALMLSVNPDLQVGAIKQLIRESADDIRSNNAGYEHALGSGRVNARKAVAAAAAAAGGPRPQSPPAPADITLEPQPPEPQGPVPYEPPQPTGGSGPVFHVETAIPPAAQTRIRERLAVLNGEISVLTGWSLTHVTMSDGSSDLTIDV